MIEQFRYLTEDDVLKLAERQFDAADVPRIVRDDYFNRDYAKEYFSHLNI